MKAEETVTINLLPFQAEDVARAIQLDHFGLFWEQGLGKTVASIYILLERDRWPALVVCPKKVMVVWAEALAEWAPEVNLVLLEGSRRKKLQLLDTAWGVPRTACVINYASLATFNYQCEAGRRRWHRNHLREAVPWQVCVADELSFVKHGRTDRSRALHAFHDVRYRLGLTGTPITHGPTDLWSEFRYLQRGVYDGNWAAFRSKLMPGKSTPFTQARKNVLAAPLGWLPFPSATAPSMSF